MKKLTHLIFTLVLIAGITSFATAQQKAIPEEKRKLISEIITLMKMDTQIGEITDTILKSMESTFPIAVKRSLDNDPSLTPAAREKIAASSSEFFQSFSKKFRERLPQVVNYPQYIEETIYPLYDKFFTEKELADLVAFYKTETGQKLITTMPQLVAESMQMSQQILLPKMFKLVDEIMSEELNNLRKSVRQASK